MKKDKLISWVAWIIGIISFGLIYYALNAVANKIGIPNIINWDETRTTEWELARYGRSSMLAFSIMLSARIGMAIYKSKINGGVSKQGNIIFVACLIGIILYGVQGTILLFIFKDIKPYILIWLLRILEFPTIFGIFFICKNWHDKQIK